MLVLRAAITRAVEVRTTIPFRTGVLHAVINFPMPSISTIQTRHAVGHEMFLSQHKVGILIFACWAASTIEMPAWHSISVLSIISFTFSIIYLLP